MSGEEAVGVIKTETGFTDVRTLPANAPLTLDDRTNRIGVLIDTNGVVSQVPSIASMNTFTRLLFFSAPSDDQKIDSLALSLSLP